MKAFHPAIVSVALVAACGSDSSGEDGMGGSAGSSMAGRGGAGATGGTVGTGGSGGGGAGGSDGGAGVGGSSAMGGSSGSGGAGGVDASAGTGGVAGAAGSAGVGAAAGTSGTGATGGASGTGGVAGSAGTSGTGGAGAAGAAGISGDGGLPDDAGTAGAAGGVGGGGGVGGAGDGGVDGGPGDECTSAQQIVLDGAGRGSATGTFSTLSDDYQTSSLCGAGTGGRDAVYFVDLPNGTWDLVVDTIGSAADTVLAVALGCDQASFERVCNDDFDPSVGDESRMWVHRVTSTGGTRLYIMVDGFDATAGGGFQLNVQRTPARPDTCPSVVGTAPLDISGGGTLLGVQTNALGQNRGSCQPVSNTSGEAIFRLTGPSNGSARFDVYSTDFVPQIYLRTACAIGATEIACQAGAAGSASITQTVTPGTTYYFFVDGGLGSYAVYYSPT